ASDGIFSFSFMPIKLIRLVGVVVIGLSIIGGIFLFYLVELGNVYKNWLLPSIFFVGGINLMALAILGEYISRIYEEVRGRPIYIIRNKTGF
ncbi:MAG: glycosyltransferase, partial [Patescibacteria group bacterium]